MLKEDLDVLKEKLHSSKISSEPLSALAKLCVYFPRFNSAGNVFFSIITVESSQKASSSEIAKLSEELKNKDRKLEEMENGERGLNKFWLNLTEINRKVGGFFNE